jgi:hypothetical protein
MQDTRTGKLSVNGHIAGKSLNITHLMNAFANLQQYFVQHSSLVRKRIRPLITLQMTRAAKIT